IYTKQDYDLYTDEDHQVWRTLCRRQLESLRDKACGQFYDGLQKINLDMTHVPRLDDINREISPITGWSARAVPGYLDTRYFFESLQKKIFPTTVSLRPQQSLHYIEEPDIFHDVFGHVALQADPVYGDLLRTLGGVHSVTKTDQDLMEITRLFWFTVEFGLIAESGKTRILGAGLLSSVGEAVHCLSDRVQRKRFRLAEVVAQPFRIDVYQDILFVAESMEQLIEAARALLDQITERNGVRWSKR
ncbi:MAG: phenylalanine 4-monooxygenase, partial [Phycisphaerae bacterium]